MAQTPKPSKGPRPVEALRHRADTRRNIPTAEFQSMAQQMETDRPAAPVHYARAAPLPLGETRPRNADLDPQLVWRGMKIRLTDAQRTQLQETGNVELGDAQLVWRGKDARDWSDLVVDPPPIYIQEKVHPKAIIDGLQRDARARAEDSADAPNLFADFNGLDDLEARLEFYQHDQHWTNRMILGDSLQVMASLAEREGLRGKVQCIYFDPPYGIKFNSNWQVSTESTAVDDGKIGSVSREPEQIAAFRDTWKDGVHSYLSYLRDRLTLCRELLKPTGIIFLQIGDENVHRVRTVMDEVFGSTNALSMICFKKTHHQEADLIANIADYILVYCRDIQQTKPKYRKLWKLPDLNQVDYTKYTKAKTNNGIEKIPAEWRDNPELIPANWIPFRDDITLTQDGEAGEGQKEWVAFGCSFLPGVGRHWRTHEIGRNRLLYAGRVKPGKSRPFYIEGYNDSPSTDTANLWTEYLAGAQNKVYVVQTNERVVQRCILMATDPGDLVLDPTCGSGTTSTVAEQWGRRWITIDTSRVALALARTRVMAGRYPYYLLTDSREGRVKETQLTAKPTPDGPTHDDIRQGFVYERAPHVTLKSIANNAEIDVIWESAQATLEPLRTALNAALGKSWEEWQVPREAEAAWPAEIQRLHAEWWTARVARQAAIDASIAKRADVEFLYDRPYTNNSRVRVAGPFTVESLSPHRAVPADDDELLDAPHVPGKRRRATTPPADFAAMVLDHLRTAGVHQTRKADSIHFTSLTPWPGVHIGAEGRYLEGETERRAGILIGPEFGTLSRTDLVAAAREAAETGFHALIACAFNFDAHASELTQLGPLPILKARMNPDLHMAGDLKNTGRGNLFVVFGEPDVVIEPAPGDPDRLCIRILGVDVFDPQTGDIRSGDTKSIAAWFIDTDYNEESFFVRHAYFLGAQDPYKSLKTALRAEIDEEAWATLYRDVSRPFRRPDTGRIAVKVINHFGDEVMKVFTV